MFSHCSCELADSTYYGRQDNHCLHGPDRVYYYSLFLSSFCNLLFSGLFIRGEGTIIEKLVKYSNTETRVYFFFSWASLAPNPLRGARACALRELHSRFLLLKTPYIKTNILPFLSSLLLVRVRTCLQKSSSSPLFCIGPLRVFSCPFILTVSVFFFSASFHSSLHTTDVGIVPVV